MRSLIMGIVALGLAPAAAMAGGHSSFSFSIGGGSRHWGNGWSFRYSTGAWNQCDRTRVVYTPPPVVYQPAPVYVAPAPVIITPAPVYAPAPVYVEPAPIYVSPTPVYVNPAPVVVQTAPVIVSSPPVYCPPSVRINIGVREGHGSHYNYHNRGGSRYSYHHR